MAVLEGGGENLEDHTLYVISCTVGVVDGIIFLLTSVHLQWIRANEKYS